jgi:hypothetical protein
MVWLCADALRSSAAEKTSAGNPAWARARLMSASTRSAGVPACAAGAATCDAAGAVVARPAAAAPDAADRATARLARTGAGPGRPVGTVATLTGPTAHGAPTVSAAPPSYAPSLFPVPP